VGRLLRQLGFSCRKPLYRVCQRDPELVKQWKETVYPEIRKRAKKVKKYIESLEGRLEVFLLLSYSPDLNPIEPLWNHAKNNGVGRQVINGTGQLKNAIFRKLCRLQKQPKKMASFFRHPDCAYTVDS